MERFAFKIDKKLKTNLYELCRLCGSDVPDKQRIIEAAPKDDADDEEPNLCRKILDCVGIKVTINDRMPHMACTLCVDRVNDIYEYRQMCVATQQQTRQLLGIPEPIARSKHGRKRKSDEEGESILGLVAETKSTTPATAVAKKTDSSAKRASTPLPMVSIGNDLLVPMMSSKQPKPAKRKRPDQTTTTAAAAAFNAAAPKKLKAEPASKDSPQRTSTSTATSTSSKRCPICPTSHPTSTKLTAHLSAAHVPLVQRYGCASCAISLPSQAAQREHHIWHTHNALPYTCVACGHQVAKLANMTYHTNQCVGARSGPRTCNDIQCVQCEGTFVTRNLYEWHGCFMRKNGQCPRCGRRFVRKQMLLRHTVRCDGQYAREVAAPPASLSMPTQPLQTADGRRSPVPKSSAVKRIVAAVKMEPETMLDIGEGVLDGGGDGGDCEFPDDGGGGGHQDDYDDDDETDDAEEQYSMPVPMVEYVKQESQTTELPPINDDDDDVQLVELAPEASIVIDDHQTSPIKREPGVGQLLRDEADADETDLYDGHKEDGGAKQANAMAHLRLRIKLERRDGHSYAVKFDETRVKREPGTVQHTPAHVVANAANSAIRVKLEPDTSAAEAASASATAPIRVKLEPGAERDEADASEEDVYDGYRCTEDTAPVRVKLEPGTSTPAPTSASAPVRVKLEPGIADRDEAEASEEDVFDGYHCDETSAPVRVKSEPQDGAVSAADPPHQTATPLLLRSVKLEPGVQRTATADVAAKLHSRLMAKIRAEVLQRAQQQLRTARPAIEMPIIAAVSSGAAGATALRIKSERMSPVQRDEASADEDEEEREFATATNATGAGGRSSSGMCINPFANHNGLSQAAVQDECVLNGISVSPTAVDANSEERSSCDASPHTDKPPVDSTEAAVEVTGVVAAELEGEATDSNTMEVVGQAAEDDAATSVDQKEVDEQLAHTQHKSLQ